MAARRGDAHRQPRIPQRRTQTLALTDDDRAAIPAELAALYALLTEGSLYPPVINKPFCQQCSYYEFRYAA